MSKENEYEDYMNPEGYEEVIPTLEELKNPNFQIKDKICYNVSDEEIDSWFSYHILKKEVPEIIDSVYNGITPDDTEYPEIWLDDETIFFSVSIKDTDMTQSINIDVEDKFKDAQVSEMYSMVIELLKFEYKNVTHYVYYTVEDDEFFKDE